MTILVKGQAFSFLNASRLSMCRLLIFGETASRRYAPMGGSNEIRSLLSGLSLSCKSSELILEGENYATSSGRFMGSYKAIAHKVQV